MMFSKPMEPLILLLSQDLLMTQILESLAPYHRHNLVTRNDLHRSDYAFSASIGFDPGG